MKCRGVVLSCIFAGVVALFLSACTSSTAQEASNNHDVPNKYNTNANASSEEKTDYFKKDSSSSSSTSSSKEIPISLDEEVSSEQYSFTLTSMGWEDAIYPPDTSGVYLYIEPQEGKTYCLVRGRLQNLTDHDFSVDSIKATFKINEKLTYSGEVQWAYRPQSLSSFYSMAAMEEGEIYVFACIPNDAVDSFNSGEVVLAFKDGKKYALHLNI